MCGTFHKSCSEQKKGELLLQYGENNDSGNRVIKRTGKLASFVNEKTSWM